MRREQEDLVISISRETLRGRRKDRKEKIQKMAEVIELRMQKGNLRVAYQILRHWYNKHTNRAETM